MSVSAVFLLCPYSFFLQFFLHNMKTQGEMSSTHSSEGFYCFSVTNSKQFFLAISWCLAVEVFVGLFFPCVRSCAKVFEGGWHSNRVPRFATLVWCFATSWRSESQPFLPCLLFVQCILTFILMDLSCRKSDEQMPRWWQWRCQSSLNSCFLLLCGRPTPSLGGKIQAAVFVFVHDENFGNPDFLRFLKATVQECAILHFCGF